MRATLQSGSLTYIENLVSYPPKARGHCGPLLTPVGVDKGLWEWETVLNPTCGLSELSMAGYTLVPGQM